MVRLIFRRYLELGSVHRLVCWLGEQNIHSKRHVTLKGKICGGVRLSRGATFYLLRNSIYIGKIPHKDARHIGAHPAIVDREVFDRVQTLLRKNGVDRRDRRSKVGRSPLKGLLFDVAGSPMSPTFAQGKSGRRYRYYVSTSILKGEPSKGEDITRRISATALEGILVERLSRLTPFTASLVAAVESGLLVRVDALTDRLVMTLMADKLPQWAIDPQACLESLQRRAVSGERIWAAANQASVHISLPVSPRLSGGRTQFVGPDGRADPGAVRRDPKMIKALREAHKRVETLTANDAPRAVTSRYERSLVRLACLAPDIQRAILEGTQPPELTLQTLILGDLPLDWRAQRQALNIV